MVASNVDFVLVESRGTLREHFSLLDEGVAAVGARTPTESVCAGDVYAAALRGECEIRLVRVDEEVRGFAATNTTTSMAGAKSLFVWMLYVMPGTVDVFQEASDELDFMAAEQGCTGIEFMSGRAAWQRRMGRHGFSPEMIVFRKEVV